MIDDNTPKPDDRNEATPLTPANSSAGVEPAVDQPVVTRHEVAKATELISASEAAELSPAAEELQEVVAEAVPPSSFAIEPMVTSEPESVVQPETAATQSMELVASPSASEESQPASFAAVDFEPPQPISEQSVEHPKEAPSAPLISESQETIESPASEPSQEIVAGEPPAAQAPAKKTRKSSKTAPAPALSTPSAESTPAPSQAESESSPEEKSEPPAESKKKWYVVKIQSGREESIKAAIERKVKIEGLEEYFGQIAIPVEEYQEVKKVTEKKNGERVTKEKKVIKQRKKFPGYLFAEVEFNDRILYLFRETSGVGDFVGASLHRAPTPMTDKEVQSMLTGVVDKDAKRKAPTKQVVKLEFEKGDKVKIRDGPFANMEGEVKAITEAKEAGETPKVTVEVTIFGRGVPVELDYWHVDKV
jgi:transcriptional antiterminator NusG